MPINWRQRANKIKQLMRSMKTQSDEMVKPGLLPPLTVANPYDLNSEQAPEDYDRI